jgi:hypothetical protein
MQLIYGSMIFGCLCKRSPSAIKILFFIIGSILSYFTNSNTISICYLQKSGEITINFVSVNIADLAIKLYYYYY